MDLNVELPVCEDPGPMPEIFNPNVYRDAPCPRTADIEAIRRDIPITFDNLPDSPTVCGGEPGSLPLTYFEERLYSSIQLMREVKFDTPLPQKWTDRRLYDWFRGAIRGVVVDTSDTSYCCSPAKVIHIAVPRDTSNVQHWRRIVDSLVLPALVHDARHADTAVPHTCPTDQSKDARTTDMGAYGVEYFLMVWIAEHSDRAPDVREWYAWSAKALRRSAFCLECAGSSQP